MKNTIGSYCIPCADAESVSIVRFVPAVTQHALLNAGKLPPIVQPVEHSAIDRLPGFDFDWEEVFAVFDHQVYFVSIGVPPEVQRRLNVGIHAGLHDLGNDVGLENRTAKAVKRQGFGVADVQQIADQTRVVEIQLRALDQPLVEVLLMRTKQEDDIAGLEQGEPAFRGCGGYAGIACERIQIENLPGTACRQTEESFKRFKVADVDERPNVTLQIALRILGKPVGRFDSPIMKKSSGCPDFFVVFCVFLF